MSDNPFYKVFRLDTFGGMVHVEIGNGHIAVKSEDGTPAQVDGRGLISLTTGDDLDMVMAADDWRQFVLIVQLAIDEMQRRARVTQ